MGDGRWVLGDGLRAAGKHVMRPPSLTTPRRRDRERERRALADLGLDADPAAVQLDELARDVEAEPRALLAARGARARLRVLVEDVAEVFPGDADAGVGDRDAHLPAFGRGA